MIWKVEDYIKSIDKEIEWCNQNTNKCIAYEDEEKNSIYQEAFVKGLEQAKFLIQQMRILR